MQDSKKMKLLCSLGFLIVLYIVLSILGKIFDPVRLGMDQYVTERYSYYVSLMEEPNDTVDVIVMGDSLSYGMINTIDFWQKEGITSYIAGEEGQVTPGTYFELKNILENQSPKLVIIETGIMGHDLASEVYANIYQPVYDALPVMKYKELWKVMLGKTDDEAPEHFKGFRKRDAVAGYPGGEYMIPTDEVYQVKVISKWYIKEIKKLCDENNIKLLFVSMPSPVNYNYEKHNGLTQLSKELGVPYIDFNLMTDEIGFDWEADMLDGNDHVNIYGTQKISDYLLNYIKENYDIKNHSEDDRYKYWNEEAQEFKEKYNIP